MKTLRKILQIKIMMFPDGSFFNIRDILIGIAALLIFIIIQN